MNTESDVLNQSHGHNFGRQNGEINPSYIRNMLTQLLPKLLEVFTDPSVINEITQQEINSRQQTSNLEFMRK